MFLFVSSSGCRHVKCVQHVSAACLATGRRLAQRIATNNSILSRVSVLPSCQQITCVTAPSSTAATLPVSVTVVTPEGPSSSAPFWGFSYASGRTPSEKQ